MRYIFVNNRWSFERQHHQMISRDCWTTSKAGIVQLTHADAVQSCQFLFLTATAGFWMDNFKWNMKMFNSCLDCIDGLVPTVQLNVWMEYCIKCLNKKRKLTLHSGYYAERHYLIFMTTEKDSTWMQNRYSFRVKLIPSSHYK